MKLKYKILWIEDNEDIVKDYTGPEIRKFIDDLGFEAIYTHEENGENLERLIQKERYDLILTDWNLGEGYETGEKIIKHIRDGKILTEVLLYSANVSEIKELINNATELIERVSFAVGIENLSMKLKEIILLTVKKVQDVNNMRGLVIAETIDLENMIRDILKNYLIKMDDQSSDPGGSIVSKILIKKFEEYKSGFLELWKVHIDEKRLRHPSIIRLIESNIFTIKNVNDAILSIFKDKIKKINIELQETNNPDKKSKLVKKKERMEQARNNFINFDSEVIQVRNTLAHVKEELNKDGLPELKSVNKAGTTIVFNDAKYKEIRKNLRKHSENLKDIQNNLI